jgi:hypothetical protein
MHVWSEEEEEEGEGEGEKYLRYGVSIIFGRREGPVKERG